jgi:hypothetical protein
MSKITLSFNPSTVICNLKGKPLRTVVEDTTKKDEIRKRHAVLKAAPPAEREALAIAMAAYIEEAKEKLTLGEVAMEALETPFSDEKEGAVSREAKIKREKMAREIHRVMQLGAEHSVHFDDVDMEIIKARVNKGYAEPVVIYSLMEAIKPGSVEEVAKAAAMPEGPQPDVQS